MLKGDYREQQRRTKSGKVVTDKIVRSTTGVEYIICKKLGAGGVAPVFHAKRLPDMKDFVFKEYAPDPQKLKMHINIKTNIRRLMAKPLTEEDNVTPLKSFIGPADANSLIELPVSGGFGYIMELVDTSAFLSVPKLRHTNTFPDADILCKACRNIAYLFKRVHFSGLCYKDINEGNIYINNKTGEVRIIDCDNIGVQAKETIKGTPGFIAPEVYSNDVKPDTYTDYFSMATLFYRIFTGGFPLEGKRTVEYLAKNKLTIGEAVSIIYGDMALFAFDPKDTSNEIRGLVDKEAPRMYALQLEQWNYLPEEIKGGFIKTFSDGLVNADRHKRTTDSEWMCIFEKVEKESLVRCKCGRMCFGSKKKKSECIFCGASLAKVAVTAPPVKKSSVTVGDGNAKSNTQLTTVVFAAHRDISPTDLKIIAKRKQQLQGALIYPGLNEDWMKILYSPSKNVLAAVNQSSYTWSVKSGDTKVPCAPGQRVILSAGLVITVMHKKLQLRVKEIM